MLFCLSGQRVGTVGSVSVWLIEYPVELSSHIGKSHLLKVSVTTVCCMFY